MNWRISVLLLTTCLILGALYEPLNTAREPLHSLRTPLDDAIPVVPMFIIPYLSYFLYLVMTLFALAVQRDARALQVMLGAAALTLLISDLTYLTFQTYVTRPAIMGDNLFLRLIADVYGNDQPFNDFPSGHTSLSTVCAIAWWRTHYRIRPVMVLWSVLIVLSTVFVKQHYVLDIVGGVIVASISYWVSLRLFALVRNRVSTQS